MREIYHRIADRRAEAVKRACDEFRPQLEGNLGHILCNLGAPLMFKRARAQSGHIRPQDARWIITRARAIDWYIKTLREDENFKLGEMTFDGAYPDIRHATHCVEGHSSSPYGSPHVDYVMLVKERYENQATK